MQGLGEITQRLIAGPAEMVGEFEDAGHAAAAKANLDIFLKWCFSTHTGDRATPAVALIVNQSKLDPTEDRLRRADWKDLPEPRVEGTSVLLDAPKSKHARDVIRRVLMNSKPRRIFDRPKKGAGGSRRLVVIAVAALLVLGAAGAGAWFLFLRAPS
jgi:hypothetical protein